MLNVLAKLRGEILTIYQLYSGYFQYLIDNICVHLIKRLLLYKVFCIFNNFSAFIQGIFSYEMENVNMENLNNQGCVTVIEIINGNFSLE